MLRSVLLIFIAAVVLRAEVVPEGFVVQKLPLGGKALMPEDWYFQSSGSSTNFMYIFSKEEMAGAGYQTGYRIQGYLKVSDSGVQSSEVIEPNIEKFRDQAKQVIKVCDEYDQGPFKVRCLETIEANPNNPADDYHVIYSFFWSNEADMVVVTIFGAPQSTWPEAELIYNEMKGFVLFDQKKADK